MERPDRTEIHAVYHDIFHTGPYLSLSKLREAAAHARLLRVRPKNAEFIPGRSIAWKLFLISPELDYHPTSEARPDPNAILRHLQQKRDLYAQAILSEMTAPDGSWIEGYSPSGHRPQSPSKLSERLETNNPLSLDSDNPWKSYFASLEVLKIIQQDVERTFPDMPFFRLEHVQKALTTVLFIHAQQHSSVGYRQGMHEIAACLYMALDFDSLESLEGEPLSDVEAFCSRNHVAADTSYLLSILLSERCHLGRWFEWREPAVTSSVAGPAVPYVAPISQTCNYLQNVLLKSIDPPLQSSLRENDIEATLYGIRWLRLLLTREFDLRESMVLWDAMFALDSSLEIVIWVALAMLIRVRNRLISASYNIQLSVLLHYPSSETFTIPAEVNHITLLIRQAVYLRESPTVAAGAAIIYENRNSLGIESVAPPPERRRSPAQQPHSHVKPTVHQPPGFPDFAKGILDRGEQWGVNRTVLNTISGLRRNLPDLSQSFQGRIPPSSDAMSDFPAVSLTSSSETRPPWEPRTRFEMEREVSSTRGNLKILSTAVGSTLDILMVTENNPEKRAEGESKRREALERLDYVRELLGQMSRGEVGAIDEERLWGNEREKQRPPVTKVDGGVLQSPLAGSEDSITSPMPEVTLPRRIAAAPEGVVRSLPTASLPVGAAIGKSSTKAADQVVAPWNHTPSSFSSTSPYSLPTKPPPASARRPVRGMEFKESSATTPQDPLGVL